MNISNVILKNRKTGVSSFTLQKDALTDKRIYYSFLTFLPRGHSKCDSINTKQAYPTFQKYAKQVPSRQLRTENPRKQ